MKKDFFVELGKEFSRIFVVALLAVTAVLVPSLEAAQATGELAINWQAIKIVALLAIIKGVDRALHESKVAEKGITRF